MPFIEPETNLKFYKESCEMEGFIPAVVVRLQMSTYVMFLIINLTGILSSILCKFLVNCQSNMLALADEIFCFFPSLRFVCMWFHNS